MAELLVRAPLTNLRETEILENIDDLAGFERRYFDQLPYRQNLSAHKLPFELRITVLEKHGDDLSQVVVELVQSHTLGVRTWKSRHEPYEKPRVCVSLNDRGKRLHVRKIP